jgi:hypothetical protein
MHLFDYLNSGKGSVEPTSPLAMMSIPDVNASATTIPPSS